MILLGTNIVSEVMRLRPDRSVLARLNGQESGAVHLSSVTIAEISYGLALLPHGQRRRELQERFDCFVELGFAHRILSFDLAAARAYGELMASRRAAGRPLGVLDGQIAAIARRERFAVATRNVDDFRDCSVEVVNPFAMHS